VADRAAGIVGHTASAASNAAGESSAGRGQPLALRNAEADETCSQLPTSGETGMRDEIDARGRAKYREIFGESRAKEVDSAPDAFDRDFRDRVNDTLFGQVWCDEALSTEQHLLHSLCLTAALNRPALFEAYFRAAVKYGCSRPVLKATLNQITANAGFPAGNDAFRIAKGVYAELESPAP
jgi:4-carboxymuconolactone decarboxylase